MNDCDIVIIDKTNPAEPTIMEIWGVWIIMLIWMVGYISRGLCKRFYFDEENKVKKLLDR
jgi:hypothetical protein